VESDIETDRLSPKSEMRASIRRRIGLEDGDDPDRAEGPFRKAELEAIAASLRNE